MQYIFYLKYNVEFNIMFDSARNKITTLVVIRIKIKYCNYRCKYEIINYMILSLYERLYRI